MIARWTGHHTGQTYRSIYWSNAVVNVCGPDGVGGVDLTGAFDGQLVVNLLVNRWPSRIRPRTSKRLDGPFDGLTGERECVCVCALEREREREERERES